MVLPRTDVLGVGVSPVNMATACSSIDSWIAQREHHYVCVTGVHGIMESQKDSAFRTILNESGMTTPDGMPLVWLSKWRGQRDVERVYGPDLMRALCARSVAAGYRHFLYGGSAALVTQLGQRLCQLYPGIVIAGIYSPPFRPVTEAEDKEIVRIINDARPDIIWVGLSTPKQERWMASHVRRVTAPVMVGVGAAFDFIAGTKKQAPRWMQRNGLEWLFRLSHEPTRLWRRYLFNNPKFIAMVVWQMIGERWAAIAVTRRRSPL